MAPGMVDTESIAAPRYEAIWAAAEEYDLAVGVHVAYCTPLDTFGFVYSVLMGFEQVVASGLLDRYPRLRVAFLEASCNWVPFMIERLEEKANPERRRFKPDRPLDTILDRPEQGATSPSSRRSSTSSAATSTSGSRSRTRCCRTASSTSARTAGCSAPTSRTATGSRTRRKCSCAHRHPGRRHPEDGLDERAPLLRARLTEPAAMAERVVPEPVIWNP